MPSSFPSCIDKCLTVAIGICYGLTVTVIIFGLTELYKSNTYETYQCQIKSMDIHHGKTHFRPFWAIKAMHENGTTDGFLWADRGFDLESSAWSIAHRYQINKTYPCYRSRNNESTMSWPWQWNKPSKSHAYDMFLEAGILFLIGTLCLVLRKFVKPEARNARQQREQQETIPLQTSPSAYDETVQSAVEEKLRS